MVSHRDEMITQGLLVDLQRVNIVHGDVDQWFAYVLVKVLIQPLSVDQQIEPKAT